MQTQTTLTKPDIITILEKENLSQATRQTTSFKDLYLSSYLKAKGFPLYDAILDERGRTLFVFKETPELKKALMQFYDGTALVSPSAFIESFKALRSLAYSLSDKPNMIGEKTI